MVCPKYVSQVTDSDKTGQERTKGYRFGHLAGSSKNCGGSIMELIAGEPEKRHRSAWLFCDHDVRVLIYATNLSLWTGFVARLIFSSPVVLTVQRSLMHVVPCS